MFLEWTIFPLKRVECSPQSIASVFFFVSFYISLPSPSSVSLSSFALPFWFFLTYDLLEDRRPFTHTILSYIHIFLHVFALPIPSSPSSSCLCLFNSHLSNPISPSPSLFPGLYLIFLPISLVLSNLNELRSLTLFLPIPLFLPHPFLSQSLSPYFAANPYSRVFLFSPSLALSVPC